MLAYAYRSVERGRVVDGDVPGRHVGATGGRYHGGAVGRAGEAWGSLRS